MEMGNMNDEKRYHLSTIYLPFSKMVYRWENRCLIAKKWSPVGKIDASYPFYLRLFGYGQKYTKRYSSRIFGKTSASQQAKFFCGVWDYFYAVSIFLEMEKLVPAIVLTKEGGKHRLAEN